MAEPALIKPEASVVKMIGGAAATLVAATGFSMLWAALGPGAEEREAAPESSPKTDRV